MSRYVLLINALLVMMTGTVFAVEKNVLPTPIKRHRELTPLPARNRGSVTAVSQSRRSSALATIKPKMGSMSSPGLLTLTPLQSSASGGRVLEPLPARPSCVPPLVFPAVGTPAKAVDDPKRQKKLLSANASPQASEPRVAQLERWQEEAASLAARDLANSLDLHTNALSIQLKEWSSDKKDFEHRKTSWQDLQDRQKCSLDYIFYDLSQIVSSLQQIEKRPLTPAEAKQLPYVATCTDSIPDILLIDMKKNMERLRLEYDLIAEAQVRAVEDWNPEQESLLSVANKETEKLKRLVAQMEDIKLTELRLQKPFIMIQESLCILDNREQTIWGTGIDSEE